MRVQKIRLGHSYFSYIVIGNDLKPIQPITKFLRYLESSDKSPHTIRAYANHLKLYWGYVTEHAIAWETISLEQLSSFVIWLRNKSTDNKIINISDRADRKASTINSILGSLSSFYRFHHHSGNTNVTLTESVNLPGSRYKALLHHVYRDKPVQRRIISVRQPKNTPTTITSKQVKLLISNCYNFRDKFLVNLLYETGMRIGQALCLRHNDIISWDNEIHLQPHNENINDVRTKSRRPNTIHVTPLLMSLYSDYINSISNNIKNNYVFINLNDFSPLRYSAVRKLFLRLSKKLEFKVTPHMLRHSHATNLIKSGMEASFVQKRLGHASVQTTLDTYTHIDDDAMKMALKQYWDTREDG